MACWHMVPAPTSFHTTSKKFVVMQLLTELLFLHRRAVFSLLSRLLSSVFGYRLNCYENTALSFWDSSACEILHRRVESIKLKILNAS